MIGQVFGRLTVIADGGMAGSHQKWLCQCKCGNTTVSWQIGLRKGSSKSCGCLKREIVKARWADMRYDNFWRRVDKREPEECWLWTGPVHPSGYAKLGYEGKRYYAHRLAYELTHGEVVRDNMVLHHCDVKLCCNPHHMYVGTHQDNMDDMCRRARRVNANTGKANRGSSGKLTMEQFKELKDRYDQGGITQQRLADEYGISVDYASKICRGVRTRAGRLGRLPKVRPEIPPAQETKPAIEPQQSDQLTLL